MARAVCDLTEDPTTGALQPAQLWGPRLPLLTLLQPGILIKLCNASFVLLSEILVGAMAPRSLPLPVSNLSLRREVFF
jgi:hypothetical protein